jgi:TRAP-type C4-dicarboxylate transport system substrate-binding protein
MILASLGAAADAPAPVQVRLATVAPRGTSLHQALLEMRQKWLDVSKGQVKLTLHTDGVMGGEAEMVRRMGVGQIHAAMLSAVGLSQIDPSVSALQSMPMMFRSLEEVSHVRERLRADLEKRLLAKGFVALFWGDIGWIRYFSTKPAERPADFKKLKLFTWAGDESQVSLMKSVGYQPVPLEVGDIIPGLKSRMIDAVAQPPFFAEAGQVYRDAPHMIEVNWAPMVGATVVTKKVWDTIPEASRAALLAASHTAGEQVTRNGRAESHRAVAAMKTKGLIVHALTPQMEAEWRQVAEELYPRIRGALVPADIFDQVRRVLDEYRRKP